MGWPSNISVVARQFIHSNYIDKVPGKGDAVVLKEHVYYSDGTMRPGMRVITNKKRPFGVTKSGKRTHTDKKEFENVDNLDIYSVPSHQLSNELHKALHGYYPKGGFTDIRKLCDSPYVYGADVSVESFIKHEYGEAFSKATGFTKRPPTTGFLDTEASLLPENRGELTHITITHENKVFTAFLRKAFFKFDENGKKVPGDIDELAAFSKKTIQTLVDKLFATTFAKKNFDGIRHLREFEFEYYVGDTPAEIVTWALRKSNEARTDFVGIWNMDYDIPKILSTLRDEKIDPADVFSPAELPKEYRLAKYIRDNKKVDHITKKWHYFASTSHAFFYDAMCLYSALRTVAGKEPSYKLNDIMRANGIGGKLYFEDDFDLSHLSDTDWHRHMQQFESYRYIVYHQFDAVSLQCMEWKTKDAQSMHLLSGVSSLAKFTRQTRKAADTLYFNWIGKGKMLAATGTNMRSQYDDEIEKVGGAVLESIRMDYSGLHAIIENRSVKTQIHVYVNDVDFSAMYPTVGQAGNISKYTKLSTALYIEGRTVKHQMRDAVEVYFGYLVSPMENAIKIGTEFYDLPDLSTMEDLYASHRTCQDNQRRTPSEQVAA